MRPVPSLAISRLILPVCCVAAIAGCGSSGAASGGTGTSATPSAAAESALLRFSVCMRAHGVPDFPDPTVGGGLHINLGSGLNPKSPAFRAAMATCRKLLPGGGPHPLTEAQRQAAIANAQCMRTHGVPDFPDPTFPAGGGIEIQGGPGLNPQSPAFQKAARACSGTSS